MIKDRLTYYNKLVGPRGDRLATLYRFQVKPNSDYPRIYLPFDSLLNHKSRLVRETKRWLGDLLPASIIEELQLILISHDVGELIHGDVSRLSASDDTEETTGVEDLLLPDDYLRLGDFVTAQSFLENGGEKSPESPLSFIARILDTIDGNYFAFALLENYATKVGGETPDPNLQNVLDRSYIYVNKMRLKYRNKIVQTYCRYNIDLSSILVRLQQVEAEKLNQFSRVIQNQGYRITDLV